jgi:DNA polymerase III subunit chi
VTEIEFHTGQADAIGFACRLLRKAARQGARVQVTAPSEVLGHLDQQLWTFDERDFVPHVRASAASAAVLRRTPIVLADRGMGEDAPRVQVNLGGEAPADWAGIDRLIEIVSAEPGDALRGRERWRHYKALGLPLKHHGAGDE